MSSENNPPRRTGSPWTLPSNSGPRIGRVGQWNSTPSTSSSSGGRRIATLNDISSGGPSGGGGHAHAHGDDDDDDEDEAPGDEGEDWYAGGERSGISVQNPGRQGAVPGGDLVQDLLRRAAEAGPPHAHPGSGSGSSTPRGRTFIGGGHTLGSDEVDSTFIPDANAEVARSDEETAIRHLTFWRDGFSVEDGELMRYDDPANEQVLAEINSGRAPPHILNVVPGQPVELRVVKRLQDDFIPPKRKAFSGQGHRLGSPVPGATAESSSVPGSFPSGSASGSSQAAPRSTENFGTRFEVDQTKPTTSVQIRLADGSRMVARMNLTHTIADIRNFINASHPEHHARPYVIMTTFPNRTLEDDSQTIEAAGLANSVIVQRWG
ncbi:SEP-domain-containing protein [Lentinus brumalis]|uniref:SEP-domain-containing protein n=1 Tax=Lentinus brumalis TaxID=2498619 RepID=A0A371DDS7_9APHY|nr:SEP-domain-containing protein [Polyporus brumalis]